jgi:hypothetical protein
MSGLDDAKRLAEIGPYLSEGTFCMLCYRDVVGFAHIKAKPHAETCPSRSWPHIVATLEAVAQVRAFIDEEGCPDRCVDAIRAILAEVDTPDDPDVDKR